MGWMSTTRPVRRAVLLSALVTLFVARTTAIGPTVLVISDRFGLGVHTGDLVAMVLSLSIAVTGVFAISTTPSRRLQSLRARS